MGRRFSAVLNTPGSTWIYKPLFNLRMLTDTLRYDTGEVENGLNRPQVVRKYANLLTRHWQCHIKAHTDRTRFGNATRFSLMNNFVPSLNFPNI
jgi:hypothetical protein